MIPQPPSGSFRNRDNPDSHDPEEGTYPIPYQRPTVAEITELMRRVHGYVDQAAPTRVVGRGTEHEITDFAAPREDAVASRGEAGAFNPLHYTMGVTHAGMLHAGAVTGDPRFAAFTARHLQFIHDRLPYFRAQAGKFGGRGNSFHAILDTDSLDASGAMCAALIKARRAGLGPDLLRVIENWADYIHRRQFRIADGTLARPRPQPQSLWGDDCYMSVPALAQMGALTGERAWFDDAVKQVVQFTRHLFDRATGLYAHGRHLNQPLNPEFHWARANGWVMMATVELLDVLPEDHPERQAIVETLTCHIRSVAKLQSGFGLWHQMIDKPGSYLETSASAMFVYCLARAINRGWLAPVSYGSVAQAGWIGVATRVNAHGQVEGTCVGTTLASDHVYYHHRPTSVHAAHGYGPVLLAGAEMIRLLTNPRIDVQHKLRTYHYVPQAGG